MINQPQIWSPASDKLGLKGLKLLERVFPQLRHKGVLKCTINNYKTQGNSLFIVMIACFAIEDISIDYNVFPYA